MEFRANNCARTIRNCSRAKKRTAVRDCYRLYVVTNSGAELQLQEPIKDPARFNWREVTKVSYYWLEVDAMTKPMQVREDQLAHSSASMTENDPCD